MNYNVVRITASSGMSYFQNPEGRLDSELLCSFHILEEAVEYIKKLPAHKDEEGESSEELIEVEYE